MADISLRDYLAKLDALLNDGASDEVIHHCRHILQYYPKNAAAYRYLGRALVEAGNWEKAGEVFRRVLSVYPDDFTAHAGLSEVYLSLKRSEDAIWHLERAYEQDPNNQEIIDRLRELYWKVRHVEQAKVQLTAGAVARQYIRNGLYDQAITTLKQALERSPERVDLRLLLAQTNADAGHDIEAGETALGVLEVLPDCLEANRILTDMWLGVQRPSDAQRYLSRIQAVDPYLALELAQGQPVADEQFRLEELDYRQSAQKEIVSRAPDWLQQIEPSAPADTGAETDMGDWMSAMSVSSAASTPADTPEFNDDLFSTELPEDWLTATASETVEAEPPAESRPRTGLTGLLSVLNEPEEEAQALPEGDSAIEAAVDLFPALDEAEPAAEMVEPAAELDELPDLFGEAEPVPPPAPPRAAAGEADPLAWLHEHGIELVEEPAADLFDDEDIIPVQAADEVNPLAWLQGYGEEFIDQEAHTPGTPVLAEEEIAAPAEPVADQPPEVLQSAPPAVDPLDWLADESLLEEALSLEALTGPETGAAGADEIVWAQDTTLQSDGQEEMAEDNPFAWLDDNQPPEDEKRPDLSADDWFAEIEPADAVGQPAADQPLPAEPSGELEWLVSESEVPSSAADLEWLSGGDEPEVEAEPASEMPEWLMQAQPPEEEETPAEAEAAPAETFDWMAEVGEEEAAEVEAEPASEMPEWLMQAQPPEEEETPAEAAPAETFDWMAEVGEEEAAEEAEPASEMPEWLMQAQPPEEEETPAEAEAAPAETFDWMAEVGEEAIEAVEAEVEPASEMPEWLMQAQPPEEEETPAEAEAAPAETFDWMAEVGEEEAAEVEAEPASEMPEWLMQAQPPEEEETPAEAEVTPAETFDWMAEVGEEAEAAEVGAEPASEMPEWLMQAQPPEEEETPAEAEAVPAETFDWMAEVGEEAIEAVEAEVEPASEIPEWLMQAQPPEEEETPAEAEASAASEFGWLSEAEEAEEEPETAGASDWLSELQSRSAASEAELAAEAEAPWSFDSVAGDEEAAPAEVVPDWLSEVQARPTNEEAPAAEETGGLLWMDEAPVSDEAVADSEVEWLDEAEQASAPAAGMTTDWLSQLESQQPEAEAQEPEAVSSFDWMSDLEAEESEPSVIESEELPAGEPVESLDWMGDVGEVEEEPQPLAGLDVPLAEAEPSDEFDWGDEPASEPVSTTDMPDWLRAVSPVPEEEEAAASEPVSAGFSWIDDINASAEVEEVDELADFPEAMVEPIPDDEDALQEELAQSPASNAPDWLNAMVPGLDVDSIVTTGEFEAASELVEEELQPLEPGSAPASRKDFDWLMDIVDEETQQQPAVLEENERKRFVFSRQPSWLRQPVEHQDDTPAPKPDRSSTTDQEPDLPPWLQ